MISLETVLAEVSERYHDESGNPVISRQIRILAEVLVNEVNMALKKDNNE